MAQGLGRTGNRGRHGPLQRSHGGFGDLARGRGRAVLHAGGHHGGLQQGALQQHVVVAQRLQFGRGTQFRAYGALTRVYRARA